MKLLELPDIERLMEDSHGIYDDFYHYVSGDDFSTVASDSGTVADSDAAGGVLVITPSDGTVADNDESYVKQTQEVYKFAQDKPIDFEGLVQFTEENTDDANIFVGLTDAVAADLLVDNGGGPKTTASGMGFYKIDGETVWNIWVSKSTTQTKKKLDAATSLDGVAKTAGGATYQKLRCVFLPKTSTLADFVFYVDDVLVYKVTDVDYSSATEMQIGAGSKNGGANNQVLNVDYLRCRQKR